MEEDLREASYRGNLHLVKILTKRHGFDVNEMHPINGMTALHWAVKGGYCHVVKYLLSIGADPLQKDIRGITSRDLASKSMFDIQQTMGIYSPNEETESSNREDKPKIDPQPSLKVPLQSIEIKPILETKLDNNIVKEQITSSIPSHGWTHSMDKTKAIQNNAITLFICVPDSGDVIETDLQIKTWHGLEKLIQSEFNLGRPIKTIRKLPNILIRNDQDVSRLKGGETVTFQV